MSYVIYFPLGPDSRQIDLILILYSVFDLGSVVLIVQVRNSSF